MPFYGLGVFISMLSADWCGKFSLVNLESRAITRTWLHLKGTKFAQAQAQVQEKTVKV